MYIVGQKLTVGLAIVAIADFHGTPTDTAHAQVGLAGDSGLGLAGGRTINSSETGLEGEMRVRDEGDLGAYFVK